MDTETYREMIRIVRDAGVDRDDVIELLDEDVHEAKAREAAEINNGGLEDQLDYLCGGNDTAMLQYLRRTVVDMKRKEKKP